MAFRGFGPSDLEVFALDGFEARMAALRTQIRPKLVALGEELAPALAAAAGAPVYAHTASHMRRRVNPPEETWVAFGPSPRGYKRYGHLAAGVGRDGAWVRFIVKPECDQRPAWADVLERRPLPREYVSLGEPSRLRTRSGEFALHRAVPPEAAPRDYLQALLPLVPLYGALDEVHAGTGDRIAP
jgi:hypothetical protein